MKKINKITKQLTKFCGYLVAIGTTYCLALSGTQAISIINGTPIHSQSHLEQILKEEQKRAGISKGAIVYAHLSDDKTVTSYARKISNKKYEVILTPGGWNLSVLRHELYHIAGGHCEEGEGLGGWLLYILWKEPQATIYQATGLKP